MTEYALRTELRHGERVYVLCDITETAKPRLIIQTTHRDAIDRIIRLGLKQA